MAEFFAGKDWQTFLQILPTIPFETWETIWSTVVATLLALVIGLPLGVCLVTGEQGGVRPLPRWVMALLNGLVNLLRSVPFLILMIIVIPLSRASSRPPRAWVRRRCKLSPKSWCPRACPAWLPM